MAPVSLIRPTSVNVVQDLNKTGILRRFLQGMAYCPSNISGTNEELEKIMRAEMNNRNICCPQLEKTLHLAASLIELGYHDCTLTEKTNIALYNWYLIYIDDMSSKDTGPFMAFQERFLRRMPQLNPVLEALVEVLMRIYELYDLPTANSILSATFNFVNSTCIEPEIETLPLTRGLVRFPWFLRDQTGVAIAFALLLFPKSKNIGVTDYIQALSDMNFWISVTNDILSFHKEELAGERANYVYNRAYIEDKVPLSVLAEMSQELFESRNAVYAALAHCPQAADVWHTWEQGYVRWHIDQKRYKLSELSL
ncbi:isoprenoid synthase domain-containing protein [Collybia nuda]|uniref:Isoprenoid synthase domain-containing protein n=1 Tax=Collybia nuda TaxID=64659 RepID=A0A9P5YDN9_9AGAR|nr:isoprenoid synthase domain-containing protein [Collybia nuda]